MTRSELEIIIKRKAAITVTVFAAFLAINALVGGSNSSKILTNTIQAHNLWAWYQAKNVRVAVYQTTADTIADQKLAQHYYREILHLRSEPNEGMDALTAKARLLEAERDKAKLRSPYYTYAGSLLQIAIVLSSAAILAVAMPLFWASVAFGAVGSTLFLYGFFGV